MKRSLILTIALSGAFIGGVALGYSRNEEKPLKEPFKIEDIKEVSNNKKSSKEILEASSDISQKEEPKEIVKKEPLKTEIKKEPLKAEIKKEPLEDENNKEVVNDNEDSKKPLEEILEPYRDINEEELKAKIEDIFYKGVGEGRLNKGFTTFYLNLSNLESNVEASLDIIEGNIESENLTSFRDTFINYLEEQKDNNIKVNKYYRVNIGVGKRNLSHVDIMEV